jgi:hypothetical protein
MQYLKRKHLVEKNRSGVQCTVFADRRRACCLGGNDTTTRRVVSILLPANEARMSLNASLDRRRKEGRAATDPSKVPSGKRKK